MSRQMARDSIKLPNVQEKAERDRIINKMPSPFSVDLTPYKDTDFLDDVKESCACLEQKPATCIKVAKAIFIGDMSVGKTCLVNRFCHHSFDRNYKTTIGVDFEVERLDILKTPFHLQIWDTAGQERFQCIASSYFRGAHIIVAVFDLSNMVTLENCRAWLKKALECNYCSPIVFLVGTKRDLLADQPYKVIEAAARSLITSMNCEYWCVSALNGDNVEELFLRIAALGFNKVVHAEASGEKTRSKSVADGIVSLAANRDLFEKSKKKGCGCNK